MKSSSFIRDLLVKVLLIVIFIFLLMCLFPMPNLKPFYSQIFNDNIQAMKDAAEDYYTTERMPSEVGKSNKMTLKEMIDKKLIIPFVDKDGNDCNTSKSYVKVTKLDNEYELKVSLTCNKESNYVIEKIGCYNFCPTGNCSIKEAKIAEEKAIEEAEPIKTTTDKDGNVDVVVPTGYYVTQYEYIKRLTSESWNLGDYLDNKLTETADIKLNDIRTQYTGQKKVTSGTTLYEQVAYDYKDNWVTEDKWVTDVKTGTDVKKVAERTLYTGQKKIETKTTEYQHVKYGYKDNWTYDSEWTTEVKKETDILKLWKERTLYTGQKKKETKVTEYEHNKYETKENITETGYTTTKREESPTVILQGVRYTVQKDIPVNNRVCEDYSVDTNWYTSVPANTSDKTYVATPVNTKVEYGNWKVLYDSYKLTSLRSTFEGNRWYEYLYYNDEICTSACNGKSTVRYYYYRVHEGTPINYYQYKYCTPKVVQTTTNDTKVVTNLNEYTKNGYKLIKTEYNYKIKTYTKNLVDKKWTTSKTSPEGYVYENNSRVTTKVSYENLDKWVGSKEELGEYTYNITTTKQYKYAHNNKTKYVEDTKWTTSKTSPEGYVYTNKTSTTTRIKYEQLNKWVTKKESLGEYTYNIKTAKQYKYAYNNKIKYVKDTIWTTENVAKEGYELTGNTKTTSKVSYVDLGIFVNSKEELGQYTYNIQTRTQYRYKYRKVTTSVETKWATSNPGNGFEPTGNSRRVYVTVNKQK